MGGQFYVYEHWRPDTDVCFYVGKGKGRRASVMYGRDQQHRRIQAKLSRAGMCVEVRLYREGLSSEDALALEIERIAEWRAMGVRLVNRTAGGEGALDPCPETRAKMRRAKLGGKLTEEHKRKIAEGARAALSDPRVREKLSASVRRRLQDPTEAERTRNLHKSIPRSKEHYEKVAAALTGKKLSPEHIEACRRGRVGLKQSRESVEKRRAANTGKKRTPEFCARMKAVWTPERREAHAAKMKSARRGPRGRVLSVAATTSAG